MRILVATDFSACAAVATRVAAGLARRLGDGLVIAHAYEPRPASSMRLDGPHALEFDRRLEALVEEALEKVAAPLRESGLGVEIRALEGSPARALVDEARRLDARLVVLGSRGHGAVERWVTGSVADRVVRSCEHPVLAVRAEAGDFERWARGEGPLRVVVGVDPTPATDAAVSWVAGLRQAGPVDVTFVHVFWPPAGPTTAEGSIASPDPLYVGELEARFRARVGELPGEGRVTVRAWPALGSLAYALSRWAQEEHADLVVVGNHRRGLFDRLWRGSAATGVLHHARVSVLAVPSGCGAEAEATEPPEAPEAGAGGTPPHEAPSLAAEPAPGGTPEPAQPPEARARGREPRQAEGERDWEVRAFRHLVVPVDLSGRQRPALALASRIARLGGARVTLLHVVALIPGLDREEERPFYERLEGQARSGLEPMRTWLEARGVEVSVALRYGDPAREVVRHAEETGADLLVLGSHPVDPADPTGSIGTVSYKVGILASCPVLLVK